MKYVIFVLAVLAAGIAGFLHAHGQTPRPMPPTATLPTPPAQPAAPVQPPINPEEQIDRTLGTLYRQNLSLQAQLQQAQQQLAAVKKELADKQATTPAPETPKP